MSKKITTEDFIVRANIVHKGRYDYSLSEYIGYKANIIIICKIHGAFNQSPNNHWQGKGCRKCGSAASAQKKIKTNQQFIDASSLIHKNKYDYSLVEYKSQDIEVEIICPDHGPFWQKPKSHKMVKGVNYVLG